MGEGRPFPAIRGKGEEKGPVPRSPQGPAWHQNLSPTFHLKSSTLGPFCGWHHACPLGSGISQCNVLKPHPCCSTQRTSLLSGPDKASLCSCLHCAHAFTVLTPSLCSPLHCAHPFTAHSPSLCHELHCVHPFVSEAHSGCLHQCSFLNRTIYRFGGALV